MAWIECLAQLPSIGNSIGLIIVAFWMCGISKRLSNIEYKILKYEINKTLLDDNE
jgi:hypothetical protein